MPRHSDGTRTFAVLWRHPETGRQTSLTYDDEREARVARELIEAACGHADEAARIAEAVRTPGATLEAAVAEHIDLLTGVGPDTRSHYQGQLRTHIAPALGPYPVAAITYRHIAGWVRAMSEKGPSPKTIANVHGLLSTAMSTAVRLGFRADNPCVGVELPKSVATHDELTVLTQDENRRWYVGAPKTKRPRVHNLRHTHASCMIAAGTDLFVLQRRLSHESITATTETYAHLLPDQQRAAADAASRAPGGPVPR